MAMTVSPEFQPHLARWGPTGGICESLSEAEQYCQTLATGHYENFPVLSVVLPRRLRRPMSAVYAFCRWADDLGDEVGDSEQSLAMLAWWREETLRCFSGEASHPVFVALRETIREHNLTPVPFLDLIDAFEQDQRTTSYATFDDLHDYCRRSANPVGRLVLRLHDADSERRVALSDRVCTGLQLINFWQDVARDAEIGRTYLPREDRLRYGYTDAMLVARESNPAFRLLMQFQVERAREFLNAGQPLARDLRGRFRVTVGLFARGGLAICDAIEQIDYDVWSVRPTVSKRQGVRLLIASAAASVGVGR